jgi:hypothetical protein
MPTCLRYACCRTTRPRATLLLASGRFNSGGGRKSSSQMETLRRRRRQIHEQTANFSSALSGQRVADQHRDRRPQHQHGGRRRATGGSAV